MRQTAFSSFCVFLRLFAAKNQASLKLLVLVKTNRKLNARVFWLDVASIDFDEAPSEDKMIDVNA